MALARCVRCNNCKIFRAESQLLSDLTCECGVSKHVHMQFLTMRDGISPAGQHSTSYVPYELTESGVSEPFYKVYTDQEAEYILDRTNNVFVLA